MDFHNYLEQQRHALDRALDELLPPEDAFPPHLHRAMRYCLFASGKRIRPILALAASEAVGGNPEHIIEEAAALELIHTFTLIHDDLPAMDNDDYRRGVPATHRVFGEAMAILAGDALLTEAFKILSLGSRKRVHTPEKIVKIIELVAEASGSRGIVGGQVVDLDSEGKDIETKHLEYIHRHKTGCLITASVLLGGILGGGAEKEIEHLKTFGTSIGLAFQITDDILDITGSTEKLGKNTGSDHSKCKATYPRIVGINQAEKKKRELYEEAISSLTSFDNRADHLRGIGLYIIERHS